MIDAGLNETQIGTVGEQLVRYKLMRWGYQAIMLEQGSDFDILVLDDQPIRVQVKSTKTKDPSRTNSYKFNCRKGSYATKPYGPNQIDCFAFVALDIEKIIFQPYLNQMAKRINTYHFKENCDFDTWSALLDKLRNQ